MKTATDLPPPTERPALTAYDARDLIKDGTQVCIFLDDQHYILRITRTGKLILTK